MEFEDAEESSSAETAAEQPERREIKDLVAYLKIIANRSDDLSLLRVANIPKRGLGPTALERLADFARDKGISLFEAFKRSGEIESVKEKVAELAKGVAELIERSADAFSRAGNMGGALKDLAREIGYRDHLFGIYKTPDVAAKKIENVDLFIESLADYEKREESASLQGFLETMALTDMEESKEEESFGVTLISLHSSKGLEFPVVFLVGMEDGILPHKKSIFTEGGLDEERRLCYVGITRAMEELYITHTGRRIKYGKEEPSTPSRFIAEIPDDVIEVADDLAEKNPDVVEKKAKDFFSNIHAMLGD